MKAQIVFIFLFFLGIKNVNNFGSESPLIYTKIMLVIHPKPSVGVPVAKIRVVFPKLLKPVYSRTSLKTSRSRRRNYEAR